MRDAEKIDLMKDENLHRPQIDIEIDQSMKVELNIMKNQRIELRFTKRDTLQKMKLKLQSKLLLKK